MEIVDTAFPEVKLITPRRFADHRGFFVETYNRRVFAKRGLDLEFVQDNQSYSAQPGTIRGLHFQRPPMAQDKLVQVMRGAILDVAVDLRHKSPTFGKHVAVRLDADSGTQILVPAGFAHGFCTLAPDTVVTYKVTSYYVPDCDAGVLWNDPDLGIDWPVMAAQAVVSDKDRELPRLTDVPWYF